MDAPASHACESVFAMKITFSLALSLLLWAAVPVRAGDPPNVIRQYPHKSMTAKAFGAGAKSYWIYEPAEPTPDKAPVIVFHHGWLAVNPGVYGSWIEHLVLSGKIVIFPKYQTELSSPTDFLPNSIAAVRDALDVLETAPGHVRPDRTKFALIGHSAGGNLSAQMAAVAQEAGLPDPKAVIAVCPGEVKPLNEPDLARIPATTLLVVAAGSDDHLVGDCRAREIYALTTSIPLTHKKFILYRSDRRGPVVFVADHLSPTAGLASVDNGEGLLRNKQMAKATVDILDRFGFWRMADITIEAGFAGHSLDDATSKGALFRDLGRWGDGRAVTPPICEDDLSIIPRVFPTNGLRILPWNADEFRRMLTVDKP
jgi:acetyl esterase/lipase